MRPILSKEIISILLFALSLSVVAVAKTRKPNQYGSEFFECTTSSLRFTRAQKQETITSTFCYNKAKDIMLSKACLESSCMGLQLVESFGQADIDDYLGSQGTPGFKICRALGGQPEIVEYRIKGIWYSLDRCLFRDDSFVSTDFLLSEALKKK